MRAPGSKPRLVYWMCQAGGWGVLSLLKIWTAVDGSELPAARAAAAIVLLSAAGLSLTHILRTYMRAHRWHLLPIRGLALRILAASLVLAVPLALISAFTPVSTIQMPESWLQGVPSRSNIDLLPAVTLSVNVCNWALIFAAWLVIYSTAVRLREQRGAALRHSELARALQQAELRLLKSQLNPHFLFNALNTVRSLITDDPLKAQLALTQLAGTLRYTLRANLEELVPLSRELEIVIDYLELEKMRFEERLTVCVQATSEAREAHIPVMLLQTVVENAMKHGIAHLPAGGEVVIAAHMQDTMLHLDVRNPRPAGPATPRNEGTGLRNSEERLKLLFQSHASLELDLSESDLAVTRIRIPQWR